MPERQLPILFDTVDLRVSDKLATPGVLRTAENVVWRGSRANKYLQIAAAEVQKFGGDFYAASPFVRQRRGNFDTQAMNLDRVAVTTDNDIELIDAPVEAVNTKYTVHTFGATDATRKTIFAQVGDWLFAASSRASPEVLDEFVGIRDDQAFSLDLPALPAISTVVVDPTISATERTDGLDRGLYSMRIGFLMPDGTVAKVGEPRKIDLGANTVFTRNLYLDGATSSGATTFKVDDGAGGFGLFDSEQALLESAGRDTQKVWIGDELVEIESWNNTTGVVTLKSGTMIKQYHADNTFVRPNYGYKITLSLTDDPWISDTTWAKLFSGIRVFMTLPYTEKNADLKEPYFRVLDIKVEDTGLFSGTIDLTSDEIIAGDTLIDTNLLHHSIRCGTVFAYNRRLVCGDIEWDFAKPVFPANNGAGGAEELYLEVEIETPDGKAKRIGTELQSVTPNDVQFANSRILYPDIRAKRFTIYRYNPVSDVWYKVDELQAVASPTQNIAYANTSTTEDYSGGTIVSNPTQVANNALLDVRVRDKNAVLVSGANRPLELNAENVYYVGDRADDKVMAFAVNAEDVSAGQYGQFPMFVFCDKSVWAFATGGDGTFTELVPISVRHGLVSRTGVAVAGGRVYYASQAGIFALPRRGPAPISEPLHDRGTTGFVSLLDKDTSLGYLTDTRNGRRELWVAAGTKVYVYSFDTGDWSTLDRDRRALFADEHILYGLSATGIQNEHTVGATAPSFTIVTAPIHFGDPGSRKRIKRLGVRTDIDTDLTIQLADEDGNLLVSGTFSPSYKDPINVVRGHMRHAVVTVTGSLPKADKAVEALDFHYSILQLSRPRVY